jgi:hypothetical protein
LSIVTVWWLAAEVIAYYFAREPHVLFSLWWGVVPLYAVAVLVVIVARAVE